MPKRMTLSMKKLYWFASQYLSSDESKKIIINAKNDDLMVTITQSFILGFLDYIWTHRKDYDA